MSLTNAPPVVTAISDKLKACASWLVAWDVYYPKSDAANTPPLAVIEPTTTTLAQIAAGSSSIQSGSAAIVIILPSTYTIGEAETLAHSLIDEITSNEAGLWVTSADFTLASEPDQGDQDGATLTITLDITHGLGA